MSTIRPRLLIVGDDQEMIISLRKALADIGEIFVAPKASAKSALISEIRPTIMLIEARMRGFDVCKELKAHSACKDIPIILVIRSGDINSETKAFGVGAADFITRPFNPPVVQARLRTHLSLNRKSGARERRLMDIYRALSEANEAIVRLRSESDLFPLVCKIAVEYGGMALAWVGIPDSTNRIVPLASSGKASDYLEDLVVMATADVAEGQGFVGIAYRENRPAVANDVNKENRALPWREKNQLHGLQSIAAFPIPRAERPYAVMTVYNDQIDAFDDEIVSLLAELATNISFSLDNFDRDAARRQAEEELKLAAMVYQDSSEAMMITDDQNTIIAVNRAFEKITGYQRSDVIGKPPILFNSDRHDKNFYKSLWKSIHSLGRWKGEIEDKRKTGKFFTALTTINTTFNQDGSVHRRVVLFSDITKKKRSEELIWQQANFDALTGLPNRRFFQSHLSQATKKARRSNSPLALMVLDLDGFKYVNDTLGHDMGDLLLKAAAERLQNSVRESDIVARLGGDEFTVILSEILDAGSVERVSTHILKSLSEPFRLGDEFAHVSASIGITFYPEDATGIDDLLKNADQAMYAAKQSGRNQFQYFTACMQQAAQARMRLVNDLRGALDENQFEVVYQPIVELSSGIIRKAEALIRWRHPTRGLTNPTDFISATEDTGLIASIGNWVFHEVAKQAARWRKMHHPAFQISVNISPVQFKKDGINLAVWFDHLRNLDLPGQGIAVEITEGLLMDASASVTGKLLALRDAGIEVALDDFGTGYSSLSYLKKFDIDYLKIDRSFVRNLARESDDMALCEAIIVMAHKLNLSVIAEGIETLEQRDLLAAAGCDYGQGYLFSKPMVAAELEGLFQVLDPVSVLGSV